MRSRHFASTGSMSSANIHACSDSPSRPSGSSYVWFGPATKPSIETARVAVVKVMAGPTGGGVASLEGVRLRSGQCREHLAGLGGDLVLDQHLVLRRDH